MEKFIHIKAESRLLSVNQLVEEKEAVKFLTGIRKNFGYLKSKFGAEYKDDSLIVNTCVNNPEFDFR